MNMAAVENILIADPRRIVIAVPNSSSPSSLDARPDYNNFPYLPRRKSPKEEHSFESNNRFDLYVKRWPEISVLMPMQ